jgi:hypothetical protein
LRGELLWSKFHSLSHTTIINDILGCIHPAVALERADTVAPLLAIVLVTLEGYGRRTDVALRKRRSRRYDRHNEVASVSRWYESGVVRNWFAGSC